MNALEIRGLSAGYGQAVVVRDVDLVVASGESVALVGRNGAGKTTLLLSLFGLARLHGGTIAVAGKPFQPSRTMPAASRGLALTPQGRRIIPRLSVRENLLLGTAARRSGRWDLPSVYQLFPILEERAGKPGSVLSGGEQQMLAIGRSLISNPDLLFLDEPSEGLAPVVVDGLVAVLQAIQAAGTAIFLVEQHLTLVRKISQRVILLSKGSVRGEASVDGMDAPEFQAKMAL
jgi:ABC-type branched-subunit amino acid transport system ATPase component